MKLRGALLAVLTAFGWMVPAFHAQAPPLVEAPASFDVASVKITPPGSNGITSLSQPGSPTFSATNVTMPVLISLAYGVDSNRISGGPSWLESQQYDVMAKAPGGQRLSREQLRQPLQALLRERFRLALHRENKEGQGYALVVGKNGVKLKETAGAASSASVLKNGIWIQNQPIDGLAGALTIATKRPVLNETGIKGSYDIALNYAPDGDTKSTLPSLFTALQEQLGLRLEPRKVPVEAIVIDHVERSPSEN
jgi:uncharacterized protein (TIGR03435 family)